MERLLALGGCLALAIIAGYIRRKQSQNPESVPLFPELRARLESPLVMGVIVAGLLLGMAGLLGGGWMYYVKPLRETTQVRIVAHSCLLRLYDLQMTYFRAHNTFANDLDTLLTVDPDAARLRRNLKSSVDLNTLTVVGDAQRFKLEMNILDSQRTPVKVRGPRGSFAPPPEPQPLPEPQSAQ